MSSKTKSQKRSSKKGGFSMFRSPSLTTNTIYNTKVGYAVPEGVELYFIRHAHSCANMIEAYGAKGVQKLTSTNIRPLYAANPHITNFGISHGLGSTLSEMNYSQMIQPDLVCASQLIRTWETAYNLFYQYFNARTSNGKCKNPLYICPYIGENRDVKLPGAPYLDLDNQPEDIKTSKSKFNKFIQHFKEYIEKYYPDTISVDDLCKPNLQYILKNGNIYPVPNSNKATNILTNSSDYLTDEPNFAQFVDSILPKLIQKVQQDRLLKGPMRGENKPIRIVIVTHSKFMEENIVKQLSSSNKKSFLQFRNNEGKVKVYNCDVYRMSLVAERNQRKTNLFFPTKETYESVDNYVMPAPNGGLTDIEFSISEKNVAPIYFNQYFQDSYWESIVEKKRDIQKLFDIIVGLCDKETKKNGNKEYNYRNLLVDKLIGLWTKKKGWTSTSAIQNAKNRVSRLLMEKNNSPQLNVVVNNRVEVLPENERPTEVRVGTLYTPYQNPNENISERETEVRVKSPYTPYQNLNENEFSGWNKNLTPSPSPTITHSEALTSLKQPNLRKRSTFFNPTNLTQQPITSSPYLQKTTERFSGMNRSGSTINGTHGGKKKKRTVKKKSVKRKSTSFRKK